MIDRTAEWLWGGGGIVDMSGNKMNSHNSVWQLHAFGPACGVWLDQRKEKTKEQ